jgi:hypothetical protein
MPHCRVDLVHTCPDQGMSCDPQILSKQLPASDG